MTKCNNNLFQLLLSMTLVREQPKARVNTLRESCIILIWANNKMWQQQYLLSVFLGFEKFEERAG